MDTRTTPGDRGWLEVHPQLSKLWMYVGSIALRRSTSKRPLVFPFPSSAKGREQLVRQASRMNTHIALRKAGIGQ